MILIIGGAYQGKLEYAKTAYNLSHGDIFTCSDREIDFSRRCVDRIEEFTYACVRNEIDAVDYFRARHDQWQDSILICREITGGVVPLGADMRAWRQMTGKLCRYLSGEARQVTRVFCGLEQRLK